MAPAPSHYCSCSAYGPYQPGFDTENISLLRPCPVLKGQHLKGSTYSHAQAVPLAAVLWLRWSMCIDTYQQPGVCIVRSAIRLHCSR